MGTKANYETKDSGKLNGKYFLSIFPYNSITTYLI